MAWARRKWSPKSAKNQPLCPCFCSFFLPLSPRRSSHQPEPQPASPPPAPPQEANKTTNRPPRATVNLSLSSANQFLLSPTTTPAPKTLNQRRHKPLVFHDQTTSNLTPGQWQQLLLLRKVASHFTPSFTTAKLHEECELTVHVLQIINFSLGPG